eukprot:scaffold1804_cov359-Prasinococcus_capsulatus_cf.AAC.5
MVRNIDIISPPPTERVARARRDGAAPASFPGQRGEGGGEALHAEEGSRHRPSCRRGGPRSGVRTSLQPSSAPPATCRGLDGLSGLAPPTLRRPRADL